MIDTSGSMAYGDRAGTKFDYAARMAASLAYLMLGQTESVGLAAYSAKLDTFIAPHGGHAQLTRIIDTLERISPRQESSLHRAMHAVADRVQRRALMVIISDFFAPAARIREGMARLRHDGHEVIAMQILHRNEVDFPFRSWSRFKGLEGERASCARPRWSARRISRTFAGTDATWRKAAVSPAWNSPRSSLTIR